MREGAAREMNSKGAMFMLPPGVVTPWSWSFGSESGFKSAMVPSFSTSVDSKELIGFVGWIPARLTRF